MTPGCLPFTPCTPMGQQTWARSASVKPRALQPLTKAGPLGAAADEADEGQVLVFALALQAGRDDIEVLGMVVAHDEHGRAGRNVGHRVGRRVADLLTPARCRRLGRELLIAAVYPVQGQRQVARDAGNALADMAGAEQRPAAARPHAAAGLPGLPLRPQAGRPARRHRRSTGPAMPPAGNAPPRPVRPLQAPRGRGQWHRTPGGRRPRCRRLRGPKPSSTPPPRAARCRPCARR